MTDLKNKVNELYNSIKLSLVEYDFHKKTKNRFIENKMSVHSILL